MDQPLINKVVVHAGNKNVSFSSGTKVLFHYRTSRVDDTSEILDDSRKMGKPMELVIGKGFKFAVWETAIQMMSLNEVAKFTVDKNLVSDYPYVAKTLRDAAKPPEKRQHRCCAGISLQGLGYEDLNKLIQEPCDLEFIIELLKVEAPEEYKKESWLMNEDEKLKAIPELREKGNTLYKANEFQSAADLYAEALGLLEQLMINEKPGDIEWNALNTLKMPLLLNFSQCKLNLKEYYTVIEHCTTVLKTEPDNVKALFRRAKANVGAWNPVEARIDFQRVMELDPALTNAVRKELKMLEDLEKQKNEEDKVRLRGKIF